MVGRGRCPAVGGMMAAQLRHGGVRRFVSRGLIAVMLALVAPAPTATLAAAPSERAGAAQDEQEALRVAVGEHARAVIAQYSGACFEQVQGASLGDVGKYLAAVQGMGVRVAPSEVGDAQA